MFLAAALNMKLREELQDRFPFIHSHDVSELLVENMLGDLLLLRQCLLVSYRLVYFPPEVFGFHNRCGSSPGVDAPQWGPSGGHGGSGDDLAPRTLRTPPSYDHCHLTYNICCGPTAP